MLEFKKFSEQVLAERGDHWLETEILVTSADVPALLNTTFKATFHHADMMTFLKDEFGKPDYRGHFAMEYMEKLNSAGVR